MHELLNISMVKLRYWEINGDWILRSRSNTSSLAGQLFEKMDRSIASSIPEDSTFKIMLNSPYWQELYNCIPCSDSKSSLVRRFTSNPPILKNTIRRKLMQKEIKSETSIAAMIKPQGNGRADSIVYASFLDRNTQRQIILWKLGRIANHQKKCSRCKENTSRLHVCKCAGIFHLVRRFFVNINPNSPICVLDQALMQITFKNDTDTLKHIKALSSALITIQDTCFSRTNLSDPN
jgi:hypothetical protein